MAVAFDKYRLVKRIGVGGMAEVFLATQTGPEGYAKTVVIKKMLPHLASQEDVVGMFLDEARLAANLSHPNIVQLFDFGEIDGHFYMTMEFVAGETLRAVDSVAHERKQPPIPIPIVVEVMHAVCDGLHYAHSLRDQYGQPLNIVHRDLSPSNVMLTYNGGVKILDFGLAKSTVKNVQTNAGILKGKVAYMSPEQSDGAPLDARSDIFSVGTLLFLLLTGENLFMRSNAAATLQALRRLEIPSPRTLRPDVPPQLEKIVLSALSREREGRQASAEELRQQLDDFARHNPGEPVRIRDFMLGLFGEAQRQRRLAQSSQLQSPADEDGDTVRVDSPFAREVSFNESVSAPARGTVRIEPSDGSESITPFMDDDPDTVRDGDVSRDDVLASFEDMDPTPRDPMMAARAIADLDPREADPMLEVGPKDATVLIDDPVPREEPTPDQLETVEHRAPDVSMLTDTTLRDQPAARRRRSRWPLFLAAGIAAAGGLAVIAIYLAG